jgi:hypothetical protein
MTSQEILVVHGNTPLDLSIAKAQCEWRRVFEVKYLNYTLFAGFGVKPVAARGNSAKDQVLAGVLNRDLLGQPLLRYP